MGTDITLKWDEDTQEEKEIQCIRFSIFAGRQGYIMVSFRKTIETSVLQEIFALTIHAFRTANAAVCKDQHRHFPDNNP